MSPARAQASPAQPRRGHEHRRGLAEGRRSDHGGDVGQGSRVVAALVRGAAPPKERIAVVGREAERRFDGGIDVRRFAALGQRSRDAPLGPGAAAVRQRLLKRLKRRRAIGEPERGLGLDEIDEGIFRREGARPVDESERCAVVAFPELIGRQGERDLGAIRPALLEALTDRRRARRPAAVVPADVVHALVEKAP
jgi:hypothetical protein